MISSERCAGTTRRASSSRFAVEAELHELWESRAQTLRSKHATLLATKHSPYTAGNKQHLCWARRGISLVDCRSWPWLPTACACCLRSARTPVNDDHTICRHVQACTGRKASEPSKLWLRIEVKQAWLRRIELAGNVESGVVRSIVATRTSKMPVLPAVESERVA